MSGKARLRSVVSVVVLAVTVVGLVAWFWTRRGDLALLGNLDLRIVLGLVLCQLLLMAGNAARQWLILLRCADRPVPFREWLTLFVLGRFLNLAVPQGGNIYRGVRLKQDYGLRHTRYVSVLVSAAWIGLGVNVALALLVVAVLDPGVRLGSIPAAAVLGGALGAVVLGPPLAERVLRPFPALPGALGWAQGRVNDLLRVTVDQVRDGPHLLRLVGLSVGLFALLTVAVELCFAGVGARALWGEAAVYALVMNLSNTVQVTPGNLGAQEAALGLLGSRTALGASEGILASGVFRVGASLTIGLVAVPLGGLRLLPVVRRMVREEVAE